jgi:hypothetical protein
MLDIIFGFSGCTCIFSTGLFNLKCRMAAPGKITAFKEASNAIEREATFIRLGSLSSRAVLFWFSSGTALFDFLSLPS